MAHSTHTSAQSARPNSGNIRILWTLFALFRPYRLMVTAAAFMLMLSAFIALILPMAARQVIDNFNTEDAMLLNFYFQAAIAIVVIFALSSGARYYLVTRLGERVIADIRIKIFTRMIVMSPAYFERLMTGEVLSRITTDTTLILSVISSSISWFLRNILMIVGGLVLMLITTPKLTALVFMIAPFILIPILSLGRKLRRVSSDNQSHVATLAARASESLLAVQTVQAFTHEARSSRIFGQITEQAFASARTRIMLRTIITISVVFFAFGGVLGVLWIGAVDVRSGIMSAGELVQFIIYAALVASACAALSELWSELQRAAGASERLIELMKAEDSLRDPDHPLTPKMGDIVFEDVTFNFPSRLDVVALRSVSFRIKQGETVAIVGPSGAGKSTLIQLLLRFYDPVSGRITIGGADLRDMRRAAFRRFFALMPQEHAIFAASVYENILFGRPDADFIAVQTAAKAAAAASFIEALPQGYDTQVGERGILLSGGQKQRIAIARAILRNAPVMILDEATSALDAQSEKAVQQALLKGAQQGRTTIVIAHRLATVQNADRILVMDESQIVAQGTHQKLMKENALYARLAALQFLQ